MKYFIDCEFWEHCGRIEPISIGIAAENGEDLYLINKGFDWGRCDNVWLNEHVQPYLHTAMDGSYDEETCHPSDMTIAIKDTMDVRKLPVEFWGYYCDYDWVLLCQLFGSMMNLPGGWPLYCRDLKQYADQIGYKIYQDDSDGVHNALLDARWARDEYKKVAEFESNKRIADHMDLH